MRTLLALSLALWCCADAAAATRRRPTRYRVEATAYSIEGITKSGLDTRRGLIAADPRFFPLGTEVEIQGIGRYSGRYLVAHTGAEIKGREIDIYIKNDKEAKAFGRKRIWIRVLKWGTPPEP